MEYAFDGLKGVGLIENDVIDGSHGDETAVGGGGDESKVVFVDVVGGINVDGFE